MRVKLKSRVGTLCGKQTPLLSAFQTIASTNVFARLRAVLPPICERSRLASDLTLPIFEDRQGTRWIGSDRGLMRLGNGHSKLFTTGDGLPDNWVFSLAQDLKGEIWVGTRHGLARIAGDKVTKVSDSGLEAEFIAAIYADRSGIVWIGTRAGLTRYDGTSFRTFSVADGLWSNHVLVLSQDSSGTLWIGTSGGGLNCL